MSNQAGPDIEMQPCGSTSEHHTDESPADDIERGTSQNSPPPKSRTKPAEPKYSAYPSVTIIDICNNGTIKQQARIWATDFVASQIPELKKNWIRVKILDIGHNPGQIEAVNTFVKKTMLPETPPHGLQHHRIGWKQGLHILRKSAFYPMSLPHFESIETYLVNLNAARLNAVRLHALCERKRTNMDPVFIAQYYIFQSSLPSLPFPERYFMLHNGARGETHLQSPAKTWASGIGGFPLEFWEILSEVKVSWTQDNRAEIVIVFPALRFASVPKTPQPDMVTPAQSSFETLLCSDQSSLALLKSANKNRELLVKLTILDLLRSSMPLWESFLAELTTSYRLPNLKPLAGYEEDLTHAIKFSAQIRDLGSCLSFLMSSIENHIGENSPMAPQWNHLSLELRTSNEVLRNLVQRLNDIVRPKFDFAIANSNESQAISVKRLTIIASIFLPLSLASTLMAMTTSVSKLGTLWFEWVGLWLKAQPLTGPILNEVLEGLRSHLLPWLLLVLGIIVASFLVGIFDSLRKARDALKYGVIALAALIVIRLSIYCTFKIASLGLGKWHEKRRFSLLLTYCTFYCCLRTTGGTYADIKVVYNLLVPPYQDILTSKLNFEESHIFEIRGSVGRVLRAAARSKRTKKWIQDEREFLRGLLEHAELVEDPRPKEVALEIRQIAAENDEVREFLVGII